MAELPVRPRLGPAEFGVVLTPERFIAPMTKLAGLAVGIVWIGFAFVSYRNSSAGWAEGYSDIGFWWSVIAAFLAIAATVALVGTVRHRHSGPKK